MNTGASPMRHNYTPKSSGSYLALCEAQLAEFTRCRDEMIRLGQFDEADEFQLDVRDLKEWINSVTSVDTEVDHARFHQAKKQRRENARKKQPSVNGIHKRRKRRIEW